MKKTLIIPLLILICSTKNTKAQSGVPDTLAHLQTIIANKVQYIGQPFSVLKNDLQIQIKYFFPFAGHHYDKTKETSTSFGWYIPQNADEIYLAYPLLEIYWQLPLNINQSDIIRGTNNNRGKWNTDASNFYANAIIANIQLRE